MTATTNAPAMNAADIRAIFVTQLAELNSTLEMASCCLTDSHFVVGFGPNQ